MANTIHQCPHCGQPLSKKLVEDIKNPLESESCPTKN